MAGIYVHIPFCRRACTYCNFHFSTNLSYRSELLSSLHKEVELRQSYLKKQPVSTIYFGGGTPSLLEATEIHELLSHIKELHTITSDPEVTLEANPDDLNPVYLQQIKEAGINRLSIGIQSFYDEELQFMHRIHDSNQALRAILQSKAAGFENMTIDLIYGIPGSSLDRWKKNLEQAFELGVPHLSCYALTVEPRTILHHQIKKGRSKAPDEEETIQQYQYLMQETAKQGLKQYEISNFAKAGFESKHNSSYWQGVEYLGLGPSAHSFNGIERQWNMSQNQKYIKAINQGLPYFEIEYLDQVKRYNEFILTRLRTDAGIHITEVPPDYINYLKSQSTKHLDSGHLVLEGDFYRLTQKGKFIADLVSMDLFHDG